MLGNAAAARAEPDGHTLLMALSSMTFLPEAERLYDRKPSYELDQFVPIARVLADPGVLCVRSRLAVEDGGRSGRRRQEAARPDLVQLVRQLRRGACAVRDVPAGRRHQAPARAVSRRRTGADGLPRQAGRHHRAGAGPDHAACAERRGAAAGELGPQAHGRLSRRADLHRARLQGRRILHLGRAVRAEGHARAGDHAAARRHARGDGEPAGDRRVRQGREPAGLHGPAGIRRSSSRPTPSDSSRSSGKSADWTRNESWTVRPHRVRRPPHSAAFRRAAGIHQGSGRGGLLLPASRRAPSDAAQHGAGAGRVHGRGRAR